MVNVPMHSTAPMNKQSIQSINQLKVQGAKTAQTISSINTSSPQTAASTPLPMQTASAPAPVNSNFTVPQAAIPDVTSTPVTKPIPQLLHEIQKGQKVPLESVTSASQVKACLGWNVTNANCDVDVSAFLLNATGKVIGDDWFVFYGQTNSPDNSITFHMDNTSDREFISIDFSKLNPDVSKIVFVLTINEAVEKNLNFSMLKDAYIRILDCTSNQELVSFKMTDYYSNVTSMMIGEIYKHNGNWKFNAIGNGVAKDLAGLCELYGVQTI